MRERHTSNQYNKNLRKTVSHKHNKLNVYTRKLHGFKTERHSTLTLTFTNICTQEEIQTDEDL